MNIRKGDWVEFGSDQFRVRRIEYRRAIVVHRSGMIDHMHVVEIPDKEINRYGLRVFAPVHKCKVIRKGKR